MKQELHTKPMKILHSTLNSHFPATSSEVFKIFMTKKIGIETKKSGSGLKTKLDRDKKNDALQNSTFFLMPPGERAGISLGRSSPRHKPASLPGSGLCTIAIYVTIHSSGKTTNHSGPVPCFC
jgi:hypothetical protein